MSSQRIETEEGNFKEKKWKLVSALLSYDEVLHDVRNPMLHDVRNPMLHDVRNIKFQNLSYTVLWDRLRESAFIITITLFILV